MKYRWFSSVLLSLVVYPSIAATTIPATEKFLTVSDVHFDPFASCRLLSVTPCQLVNDLQRSPWQSWEGLLEKSDHSAAKVGSDSPYPLLKSSIVALRKTSAEERIKFGFFLGDFLAHNFHAQYVLYTHDVSKSGYEAFVKKTYQFLVHEYSQALPGVDIYPALGNNDAYEDYEIIPGGKLLRQQGEIWADLIHDPKNHTAFTQAFSGSGYYSVLLPGTTNKRLIVLNTVLFSRHLTTPYAKQIAIQQLGWLHSQLAAADAAHENVIIACHIPIGVDVYATLKNYLQSVVEFWQDNDNAAFQNDLKTYAKTIKIILAGHIHMDNFQILNHANLPVAISFTPAISPIYGNNPGFKVYEYDVDNFTIKNYTTIFYPLDASSNTDSSWKKEYSFNETYQPLCQDCQLVNGMTMMTPRGESTTFFKLFYAVSLSNPSMEKNFNPYYWCSIQNESYNAWLACTQE